MLYDRSGRLSGSTCASMDGTSRANTSYGISRSEPWTVRPNESFPASAGGSVIVGNEPTRTPLSQPSTIATASFQSSVNTPVPAQPFHRSALPPPPALNLQRQPYSRTVAVNHGLVLQQNQQHGAFPPQPQNYQQPHQPQYTIMQPHNPANGISAGHTARENLGHSMIQLSKRPRYSNDGKHLSIAWQVW